LTEEATAVASGVALVLNLAILERRFKERPD